MAKNTGNGFQRGAVDDRSQFDNPQNSNWVERDRTTGWFLWQKKDGTPFKGVAKEPDERKDDQRSRMKQCIRVHGTTR